MVVNLFDEVVCLWSFKMCILQFSQLVTSEVSEGSRLWKSGIWVWHLRWEGFKPWKGWIRCNQFYHSSPRFAECTDWYLFWPGEDQRNGWSVGNSAEKTCCQSWMSYMWFCNMYDYITAMFFPLYVAPQWPPTLWEYDNIDWHVGQSVNVIIFTMAVRWLGSCRVAATAPQKITNYTVCVAAVIVVDADFYFLQMNQMKLFSISILKFDLNEFVWFHVNLCMDARQLSLVVPTKTMCWLTQVTKDMRETTFGCHWTPVKAVRSHCCPQSAVDLVSHGKPVFALLVTRFLPTHLLHVALF